MSSHLFLYPGAHEPGGLPDGTTSSQLPVSPEAAARVIETALADRSLDTLVFWDPRVATIARETFARFASSRDDAWTRAGGTGEPDLLRYAQPLWLYRLDPLPDVVGAIQWRLDPRATLVRAAALRAIGGLDPHFDTLAGAFHELGLRMLKRGAVCRQQPRDIAVSPVAVTERPTLADRYRLLRSQHGAKWLAYTALRRIMEGNPVAAEVVAWRTAAETERAIAPVPVGALQREVADVELPRCSVSVVLPTFGRYRYLAEVLEDIRAQTIRPTQILIADGNVPEDRDPSVYERFRDLPIEVLWDAPRGICAPRNACLDRVTGDYVWFVDDDSRFAPDNLESHLRVLVAYGADVSVGPAYTRSRPELHGEQREVVVTHMDCGTTLCKRWLFETVGKFDMQFNQHLAGEDGEIGIRFVRAGGLMVNNPHAKRFHYVAPVGGSRQSKNAVHYRWSRWSLLPRPVQSIYYTAKRYFEPGAAWDAMVQAGVLAGWRRREGQPATRSWRLRTLIGEVAAAPVTLLRLRRSVLAGRELLAGGPRIPPFKGAGELPQERAY